MQQALCSGKNANAGVWRFWLRLNYPKRLWPAVKAVPSRHARNPGITRDCTLKYHFAAESSVLMATTEICLEWLGEAQLELEIGI
jgi:hypothetical protein